MSTPARDPGPTTMPVTHELVAQDLQVELDADQGVVRALDRLSFSLRRGETFALVGESGCGKSMTALALMRLLPENGRVAGGSLRLGETEVLDLPEAAMRAVRGGRVGMIFQEPSTSLNPVMKVGDQLVEAIEAHTALRGAAARERAVQWLERVGIPEPRRRIDDYPFRMSGGQKQRVMIAMALAAEPDFLIADEPTTALDVTIQKQVLDLLKDLQREKGMGLLLITHDLGVVADMADHVALMYAGQIIEVAPAAEFFARPRHPYARLLLQALPDAGRRGEPLAAIAGTVPPLWLRFDGCRFAPRCPQARPDCGSTLPPWRMTPGAGGGHGLRCVLEAEDADRAAVAVNPAPQADPVPVSVAAQAPTTDAGDPLLDVQDLHVTFEGRRGWFGRGAAGFRAVDGISFALARGRTLALVGESGCGKTTTGKAVVQLLRRTARVEGRALLEGRDLFALHGADLQAARRDIQIIFQDPFASLNPRLRVADILEEGVAALCPDLDTAARRARIAGLVDQVGLRPDALARFPHEFSGGQRQRIAIARALAVRPKVIVCDEPTSALDVSVQAQILNLLRELQRETGVSLLFITHNIGVVEYVADEVAVMNRGRIVEAGPVARVLGAPQDPFTKTLLAAVPRLAR